MGTNKFLKAKCRKTERWYGLELKQYGGLWKVINMIDLSDSEAAVISSDVKQTMFETNDNLLPCSACGSRRIGGCGCSKKKHRCSKNMNYQFDCIYCNEMEIDYTIPSRSDVLGRVGDTVTLSQGQEVKIRYADDRPLSKIYVGVGWDPARAGASIDVDSSVVVMSGQSSEKDLVYFGAKEHPSGCVIHHGDNLTGEDNPNTDDENISVYLNKVPGNRDRLVFVLNIYKCDERHQTFGGIKNLYIKLYDLDSKSVLVEYRVKGNFNSDTALIIGMAYRKDSTWMFKAIGKGSRASTVSQLADECSYICR